MSSQLTSPPVQPDPAPATQPRRIELSASQVIGGALAAMTAAALGSRLGVAGTIIGAALASIVAAVGGSLYTASIRASRERVRTVLVRRPASSARTDAAAPPNTETAQLVAAATDVPVTTGTTGSTTSGSARKRLISWKTAGVGALAAFALAAVAVTGFESATGNALSGGSGTTITQVRQDASGGGGGSIADPDPSTTPSASVSSEPSASSASSDSAPAEAPSAEPSASTSAQETASAEPTPSASTSVEPTPSTSATPSATPTDGTTGAAEASSTPTTQVVPAG